MKTLIKCRNWQIEIDRVDGEYMGGWLGYIGAIIPGFGSCMSFCVERKQDDRLVLYSDNPEYLPEYLKKRIFSEYKKANRKGNKYV